MPQFHARTLDLLPRRPTVSKAAAESIAHVERRIAMPLPTSLREWYSYKNACEILETYSNDDPPVALNELGRPHTDWESGGTRDLVAEGLLVIRHENQGVCRWAARLDGSDDPPVVVAYDSALRGWQRCADRFSDYVYSCVWDYTFVFGRELLIQAQNGPLTEAALRELRSQFGVELTTYGWPGHTQYRFEKDDRHLLIWVQDDQADWWLAADAERSVAEAMDLVWRLDQVGDAFWSNTDDGQAVVDRMRSAAGSTSTPAGKRTDG